MARNCPKQPEIAQNGFYFKLDLNIDFKYFWWIPELMTKHLKLPEIAKIGHKFLEPAENH